MRAGLAASTVTPGSTAPVVAFTSPAMAPLVADCARAAAGTSMIAHRVMMRLAVFRQSFIDPPRWREVLRVRVSEVRVERAGVYSSPLRRDARRKAEGAETVSTRSS